MYSPAQEIAGLGNSIHPLPGLRREDADVAFIYLVNGVRYYTAVDDPWFSAHKAFRVLDSGKNENMTLYKSDSPFSMMGCTIQVLHERLHRRKR
jgi:hypothetical protein